MKLDYFPETDSLYIELNETPGVDAREIAKGIVIDFDADGNIVGIDIDHASKKADLKKLDLTDLPVLPKRKERSPSRQRVGVLAGR